MITEQVMARYDREGYAILDQVVPSESLGRVQESYEETIEAALSLGLAPLDEATGFLEGYRFQNPHHPSLARRPLMEALGAPAIMAFAQRLCGEDAAMHGVAAFAMNEEYDYRSSWHRDSYFAWGKDSPTERRLREVERLPATQVLVALEDDASFWYVPGSHNRANTAEEEEGYDEGISGWDAETVRPGAVQVRLEAGSAAPFDARGIHRGLKGPGVRRRSLFIIYGDAGLAAESSVVSDWAREPEYADPAWLDSLPEPFRRSMERTMAALREA
ncbi:MAG: phytanoyl-CoA dioxygenase family protein [Gemmatimonadaceae bacterium]|nr:phytanoyl-CoA dioxygenase family protein [Gemmatimonadaceae bacterium]